VQDLQVSNEFLWKRNDKLEDFLNNHLYMMPMSMKNILLVDDHAVVRTGLNVILHDYYPEIRIFEAADEDDALDVLRQNKIDLLVLDLQIPNTDSIGLVELISIKHPSCYILIFSMLPEVIYARRVLKAGASGFLPKDSSSIETKRAFDLAFANKKYTSQTMTEMLANEGGSKTLANPFDGLSHREFEIVRLLLAGNNLAKIATLLNIRPSTAGTYKARLFEKLRVNSLFELKEVAILYDFAPVGIYSSPASKSAVDRN
jgi:two-component system, NarL family, invasion response regulator UvrY